MEPGSQISRRGLITGLIALVAAPAIVRAGSLMPVKLMQPEGRVAWATGEGRFVLTISPSQMRDLTDALGRAFWNEQFGLKPVNIPNVSLVPLRHGP